MPGLPVRLALLVVAADTWAPLAGARVEVGHLRVYLGEAVHATLQLFFADALNAEIYARHPEYAMRGQPDITNATDFLIRGEPDLSNLLFTTARMPDGAMLASKVGAPPSPARRTCP